MLIYLQEPRVFKPGKDSRHVASSILNTCLSFAFRLDVILGKVGSKAKDVYDSKQSLASRIVKVERTVSMSKQSFSLFV